MTDDYKERLRDRTAKAVSLALSLEKILFGTQELSPMERAILTNAQRSARLTADILRTIAGDA